jgi:ketosteroid isomerase-like protein
MTMTASPQVDLGTAFFWALRTKNWKLLREIMSPDATWSLPGQNAISGTAAGIDDVIARAQQIGAYRMTSTLERVLVSRDNIALGLHATARRGERVLDEHIATVCTVRAGRIVQVETYLDDLEGMNRFFTGEFC